MTGRQYLSPECRRGMHELCRPGEVFIATARPGDLPAVRDHCACTCGHQRCSVCGHARDSVRPRHVPANSGPGWEIALCDPCAELPPDPDTVPDTVTKVLLRRARPPVEE